MSDTGKAVFLSYASQDAEAAKRICDALRAAGVEVWFDQSELRGGDAWDTMIRKRIKDCALFVPVISANTQARLEGYFRREWRMAVERMHDMDDDMPFLIPVVIDDTPDATARVPERFRERQWTRLPGGETPPMLVERVRRLFAGEGAALAPLVANPGAPRPVMSAAATVALKSVAVLAFANLSNDPDNEFFSDGISEELINVLVRIPDLKVSARTSAFHFKGKHTPVPEVARQLGVAYVVEGSVRKAGDRVRITAQLIKAADGFHVWSDTFTRDLKDIFAVQDEIAGLIAQSLSLKLIPSVSAVREVNPEAYRLFLEGRTIFNREVPSEYAQAIHCFQESLQRDPDAALTWVWLSLAYVLCAGSGTMGVIAGMGLAREAAQKAITLEPQLAKAHMALAMIEIFHDWNWKKADTLLQQALALAPGDVDAMGVQVTLMTLIGKHEQALPLARKAVELDPLGYFSNAGLMRCLYYSGQNEQMVEQVERMISLNPSGLRSRLFLCCARLQQGRFDEAAQAAELVPAGWAGNTALALARFAQGRLAESDAALQALTAESDEHAQYQMAQVYAYRGDLDEAFAWLELSRQKRDTGTPLVKCDPLLGKLRADPRWVAFVRKMGLADDQLT